MVFRMKKHILLLIAALCLFVSCQEEPVGVSSVAVDKENQTLSIGASFVLKAIISPSNADNQKVIWTVENSSVVDYADRQDGSVTLKGLQVGTSKVTARTDDGGFTASCYVKVGVGVEKIELDKSELRLYKGGTTLLTATIFPEDASDKSFKWGTSDSSVATVDANGKVDAVGNGEATVFVSSSDGGFTAYCNVIVTTPVTGLSISPVEYTLESIGSSFTIKPTVSPEEASDAGVVWNSSDTEVVSVSSDGTVTAVGPGTAAVTATTNDGSFSASCTVTVKSPAQHISLDKTSLKLLEGESARIVATVCPSNSTQKDLTWTSDAPAVASVDANGNVTALKAGTAKVTVKVSESVSAVCEVTVISRVTGISLDRTAVELKPGETHQLKATVLPENASDAGVTWYSDKEGVATVSQSGLVTAVGAGEATVHAVTSDGGKMASCLVTVRIPVKGITLSTASETLYVGDSPLSVSATVYPADATEMSLEWSSTDSKVASVIQGAGLNAVINPLKPGTATITVSTKDGGFTAKCTVTVKQHVSSVSVNKKELSLYVGGSESLTATVLPSDASDKSVTWTSSNTAVASVSADGKVTANKAGTAVVTVKTVDGGCQATCTVTVKQHVTSVSVNKKELSLYVGGSESLTATVLPSDASDKSVTWTSSNTAVASVSADGKVTANKAGTAVVTVKTVDGGCQATCTVTVKQHVTSVSVNKKELSLYVGGSESLTATVLPSDASDKSVTWTSSNTAVAGVSADGKVTANKAGTAVVTVKTVDGGYQATCTVTVKQHVSSVSVNKKELSLYVGGSESLTATVLPSDASDKSVTWTSSNTAVAGVSADGKVTANKAGTAVITVKTVDGGCQATCTVTVRELTTYATSLTLSPQTLTLDLGGTEPLTLVMSPTDANEELTWKSDNESVAKVVGGDVTAVGVGVAKITVKGKNVTSNVVTVTVVDKYAVTGVELDAAAKTLEVGEEFTLAATVKPADARDKSVSWSSSAPSVATVDNGVVKAVSAGTATIKVTAGSGAFSASCVVTVNERTIAITDISYPEQFNTINLKMGASYTIRVKVSPDDANEQLKLSPAISCPVTCTAVKEKGTPYWNVTVTAIYKEGKGALFIESESEAISSYCTFNVTSVPVTGVRLDVSETSMRVGQTLTLTPTVSPSDASIKGVTWSSSDSSVAYVSQSGIVTARSAGKVTITATSKDNSSITGSCTILVRSNTVGAGGSEGIGFIDWN